MVTKLRLSQGKCKLLSNYFSSPVDFLCQDLTKALEGRVNALPFKGKVWKGSLNLLNLSPSTTTTKPQRGKGLQAGVQPLLVADR